MLYSVARSKVKTRTWPDCGQGDGRFARVEHRQFRVFEWPCRHGVAGARIGDRLGRISRRPALLPLPGLEEKAWLLERGIRPSQRSERALQTMRNKRLVAAAGANAGQVSNREKILGVALQVFAEFGFTGASTREIARRAGMHQPIIAYYFRNKEQLWRESIESAFKELLTTMIPVSRSEADPDRRLWCSVNAFIRAVARRPEWAALVVHEGLQLNERNIWMIETWMIPLSRVLYVSLAGRKWPAKNSSSILKAQSLLSVLGGSTTIFAQQVLAMQMSGVDISSESFVQTHVETVYLMLKAVVQPAGGRTPRRVGAKKSAAPKLRARP